MYLRFIVDVVRMTADEKVLSRLVFQDFYDNIAIPSRRDVLCRIYNHPVLGYIPTDIVHSFLHELIAQKLKVLKCR